MPTKIACDGEQAAMKNAESFGTAEVMILEVSAGGYEVSAAHAELVERRVGPRSGSFHQCNAWSL